jgi:hypothetical protein
MSFRPNVVVTVYKLNSYNKYEVVRQVPQEVNPNDPDVIDMLITASINEDLIEFSGNKNSSENGFASKFFSRGEQVFKQFLKEDFVSVENDENRWHPINDCWLCNLSHSIIRFDPCDFNDLYTLCEDDWAPTYEEFLSIAAPMMMVFRKYHPQPTEDDCKKFIFSLKIFFDPNAVKRIENLMMNYEEI